MGRVLVAFALALVAAPACTTTRGAPASEPNSNAWVRDIDLSPLRAQVGQPFTATLSYRDNFIDHPEYSVSGLPPGLVFDAASKAVKGTPSRAGFFTLNVAVRKAVPPERAHRPRPDERWWPATFELEVYAPVDDPPEPLRKPKHRPRR
jgi:hypothetical protein